MARHQRVDVEFAGAVEAGLALRHVLAQQPVGADDRGGFSQRRRGMIDHEQMVAYGVERIDVASRQERQRCPPPPTSPCRTRRSAASGRGGFPPPCGRAVLRARRSAQCPRRVPRRRSRDPKPAIGLEDRNNAGNLPARRSGAFNRLDRPAGALARESMAMVAPVSPGSRSRAMSRYQSSESSYPFRYQ